MQKEWHKILAQIFLQLALLPPLGHKEAIKTGWLVSQTSECPQTDKHTNTGLYDIDGAVSNTESLDAMLFHD